MACSGAVSVTAIVVAAGAGVRLGLGVPKAFVPVAGRPMVEWSLRALAEAPSVTRTIVVGPADGVADAEAALGEWAARVELVPGGSSRAQSVAYGLGHLDAAATRVVVHDAARPLVDADLIERVIRACDRHHHGAIAAAPVADTLKRAGRGGVIDATIARTGLWGAQTPQVFWAQRLRHAVEAAIDQGRLELATDCASLVEGQGPVALVEPGRPNFKVTTASDRLLAEAILATDGRAIGSVPRPPC